MRPQPTTALEPDAALGGDVVVFALYYPTIKDAVREYADRIGADRFEEMCLALNVLIDDLLEDDDARRN